MASSEKYSKLDCRGVTIIEFLADQQCAGRLADKLYHEKRLISKTVCGKAHATHASDVEKIRPLFNAVLSKVKVDPQNYDKFISVLEDMPAMQDIVEFIEKPLSKEELLRIQGPRVQLEQDNETRQSSADQREITDNHNRQNKGESRGWCSWTRCLGAGTFFSLCVIATAVTLPYVMRVQYWNVPNDVSSEVQPSTRGDRETTWTPPATSASSVPQPQPTSGTYQGPGTQELPTSGFLGKRPTMKQLQLIKWPSGDKIMPIETIATHWRKLGTTLGIPETVLKGFSTTHMKEQEDCCREVLQRWLERGSVPKESYPVNWEGLINALEDTGLDVVADDMRQMISRNEDGEPALKPATTVPTIKHAMPTEPPVQVKLSAEDFAGFPEPTVLQLSTFLSSEVAAHWEEIGEALQIKQGVLSSIRANNAGYQNQHERCLREVFKKWYNGMTTEFSWRKIAEILLSMDEARVVEGLHKKLKEN